MLHQKLNIAKKQKGFTLVELALYGGLLSILLVVFTQLLSTVLDAQLESQSVSSITQATRFIASRMAYDFLSSSGIASPSALGQTAAMMTLTKSGQSYTYSLSGSNLLLTDASDTNVLNNFDTRISNVSFTRIGNANGRPQIRVMLTITGKTLRNGLAETSTIQTTYGLR